MKSLSFEHRRNSNRFESFDYTQPGAYFVTIITKERFCLFGDVIQSKMILNPYGKIANDQWMRLNCRFLSTDFSTYVIMPNHVHGVIFMTGAGVQFRSYSSNLPLRLYYSYSYKCITLPQSPPASWPGFVSSPNPSDAGSGCAEPEVSQPHVKTRSGNPLHSAQASGSRSV